MKTVLLLVCALVFVLGRGTEVCAQTRSMPQLDDEAARILYEAGQRFYELGRYAEALKQFDEAYKRSGRVELRYNMGRCHEQLGNRSLAVRAYRDFLAAEPQAQDGEALAAHVAELEASEPPPAIAGPPVVEAPRPRLRRYPFIVAGIGVGLLAASVGTGVTALRMEQRLDGRCPLGLCPVSYPEAPDDRQLGQRVAVATDVLLGVGGAVTAAGLVCLIVEIARYRSHR